MIRDFADKTTERLFLRERVKRFSKQLQRAARRKLLLLHSARSLDELAALPGNRLEKLVGDRAGQYSLRVNDQWRLCFIWTGGDARQVEITDYH